jgi:hypothetical protein
MSVAVLAAVLCGLGCIAFALEDAVLRAPLVVGAGLLLSFGAFPAWLLPARAGGR